MNKKIRWTPGTKKDLRDLGEDVRADFGYGLYLVQEGKEVAEIAQAIAGLKVKQLTGYGALIYELKQNFDKDTYRCCLHGALSGGRLRAPRLQKEVKERHRAPEGRRQPHPRTLEMGRRPLPEKPD